MALIEKQKEFIRIYLNNGLDRRGAYQQIYTTCTNKAAYTNASNILAKPEADEYIKELQAPLNKKDLITKEQILLDLIEIKNNTKGDNRTAQTAIKALESISKLLGFYEAKKIELSGELKQEIIQIRYKKEED